MEQPAANCLPAGLHIILGDSAAGTFNCIYAARERLLIDQDVLCCGPTPHRDDLRSWISTRNEFWTSLLPGADSEHVHSPFNLVDNAKRLCDAGHIHIWAATSVSEQLFIAQVIHLAQVVGANLEQISVIQVETLPGRQARVLGMGELDEAQMVGHPEPVPLSSHARAAYQAAWRALTAEDPRGIERFASEWPHANAWLKTAMQLMLSRFPDARTGLSYWDSVLLKQVREHGPRAAKVIGQVMAESWDVGNLTGDSYVFGRLLRLGDERLPKPLITLTGDRTQMRNLDVTLTPFGEDVLAGRAPNYPVNPIDDWAAGARLSSAEHKLWFNDGSRLVREMAVNPNS